MTVRLPSMANPPGKIYLVPTPIGNLGDITRRAIETLQAVDLVACEDTRVSGRLLKSLNLKKKLISYHEFNERARSAQLVRDVQQGKTVAVITDAGSPGISDPAYRIVKTAIESGLPVEALPGPSALLPALTASGLPTDRFTFEGFLPNRTTARRKRLTEIKPYPHTLVFYESPHRVHRCLDDMLLVLGDRPACLAREISKKFETYIRGALSGIIEEIGRKAVKGEIVLVVAGDVTAKRRGSKVAADE